MRYNLGVLLLCPEDVTLLGGVVSGLDESDKQDALLHDVIGGPGNEDSCIFVDDFSKLCSDIWEKHPHIIVKVSVLHSFEIHLSVVTSLGHARDKTADHKVYLPCSWW